MILVSGATGNVGRQVVLELRHMNVAVRALTRHPDTAGLPNDIDVVGGDLSDPKSLDAAIKGVDGVFLLWPFLRLTADAASPALDVIQKHGPRVVFLSSLAVRDHVERQSDANTQFHADIEQAIERSGIGWTFLRCAGFAANTLMWAPQIRTEGVVHWPYGAAARSLIHERDIAAVAARALNGDAHRGTKHVLTGPQSLTQIEELNAIGEAIGRPLRWDEIAPETARAQMLTQLPPELVDGILDAHAGFVARPEPVTTTVQDVTGEPARTFREWAADHAEDFRQTQGVLGTEQAGFLRGPPGAMLVL
jgi:uncharacterized protein YbjT (DUF2867 family)